MDTHNISDLTIEYVENNINNDLNLDAAADFMNYSKFHFHRLFLSEMGISITEYVRRRRIIRSAYMLLLTQDNISAIAYDFGFCNVDTYIRCFKRYYGITPSEYRKLKFRTEKNIEKECVSLKGLVYDLRQCNLEDKKKAVKCLEKIIELSKAAHRKGLLALEDSVSMEESPYLHKAIQLLVDGTEPKDLKEILSNYIQTSNLTPYELLERLIYQEGILLIQQGAYPWDIRKKLEAYFGENFINVFANQLNNRDDLINKLLEADAMKANKSQSSSLDNELKNIDKRSLQRLLRECDIVVVAIAFTSCSSQLKKLVIEALPKGQLYIYSEVLELIGEPNAAQIIDAQNEIIKIIRALRLNKDIK